MPSTRRCARCRTRRATCVSRDWRGATGYVAKSPKFYVFRFGQRWPEHRVLVKFGKVKLRCGHTTASEALKTATIDVMNHGFNALVNVRFERLIDRKTDYVVGFPALLVSKNYHGDVNLLAERCIDDFKDAVYCTVCTPKLDQEFEDALEEQRTPKVHHKGLTSGEKWLFKYHEYLGYRTVGVHFPFPLP